MNRTRRKTSGIGVTTSKRRVRALHGSNHAPFAPHPVKIPSKETVMAKKTDSTQVTELLIQALETERGGIKVYTAALQAAVNEDLKKEWSEYLDETRTHEQVLLRLFEELG